jgi:hypothetical protein
MPAVDFLLCGHNSEEIARDAVLLRLGTSTAKGSITGEG